MSRPLVATFAAAMLVGCQTVPLSNQSLLTTDTNTQKIVAGKNGGEPYINSRAKSSSVLASLSDDKSYEKFGTGVIVKIKNTGKSAVQFGSSDIIIEAGSEKKPVLGYDGIQQAIKQDQSNEQARATFVALASGIGAGLYAGSGRASPVLAGAMTSAAISASVAQAQVAQNVRQEGDVLINESDKAFLASSVVPPGAAYGGQIVVPARGRNMMLYVTVGDDVHMFSLTAE